MSYPVEMKSMNCISHTGRIPICAAPATVSADVFAEAEHILVAFHLLKERFTNRLEVRDLRHRASPSSTDARALPPPTLFLHGTTAEKELEDPRRFRSAHRRAPASATLPPRPSNDRSLPGRARRLPPAPTPRGLRRAVSSHSDRPDRSPRPSGRSPLPERTTGCRARRVLFACTS